MKEIKVGDEATSLIGTSVIQAVGLKNLEKSLLPGLLDGYDFSAGDLRGLSQQIVKDLEEKPQEIMNTIQQGEVYQEAEGYRVSVQDKGLITLVVR